jgi:hypothetical protein
MLDFHFPEDKCTHAVSPLSILSATQQMASTYGNKASFPSLQGAFKFCYVQWSYPRPPARESHVLLNSMQFKLPMMIGDLIIGYVPLFLFTIICLLRLEMLWLSNCIKILLNSSLSLLCISSATS